MKFKIVPVSFLFLLAISSCNNHHNIDLSIYKTLDISFFKSISEINSRSNFIVQSMKDSLTNPSTHLNKTWCEAAFSVNNRTNKMESFINNIKVELKKEANVRIEYRNESAREVFNEDDVKAVETIFNKKNMADELEQEMLAFRGDLLKIDTALKSKFYNDISIYFPDGKGKTVYQMYFNNLPTDGALAMLTKFLNDAIIFKCRIIEYCDRKSKE